MLISLILFALWLAFLLFLKKLNMKFFLFLTGSIGLFCFLMYAGTGTAEKYLEQGITYCMWLIGRATGMFTAYPQYTMMTIYHRAEAISFFIDYECSGFIEILVYICLLLFYPFYSVKEKGILGLVGVLYVTASNLFRLFVISGLIKLFGTPVFFFSHTVFGRIIFFALMVILYYMVFTKPHMLRQKVGSLRYAK